MATITSAGTGNWATGATWVGGSAPADGDTVVIAAGHVVTFNADHSAWVTGIAGLTITSHATTPGELICSTSAGTYTLMIATGTAIAGTNAATFGKLTAGSSGTPLPNTVKFVIRLKGTGYINGQYLDIQLWDTEPANKVIALSGAEAAGQTELSVDTDVTGDVWAVGDQIAIADVNGYDCELRTIAAAGIAAGAITVTAGLTNAKIAGAQVVRVSRNIQIISETTTAGTLIIDRGNSATIPANQKYLCSILVENASATTKYGVGIYTRAPNDEVDFVVWGAVYGHRTAYGSVVFNGIAVGCTQGLSPNDSSGNWVKSTARLIGCETGISGARSSILEGTVRGSTTGISGCTDSHFSGTVDGCTTGFATSSGVLRNLKVGYPYANGTDINLGVGRSFVGYATSLPSATAASNYLGSTTGFLSAHSRLGIHLYDVLDSSGVIQAGCYRAWTPGGTLITEAYSSGTHGTPPVTLALVHKFAFAYASFPNWFQVPFWGTKDKEITVQVYVKKDQNSMTATPWAMIVDPNLPFGDASEDLDLETMADNTDWQTLTLTYTPSYSRPLALRVGGAHGSGTLYWNFVISAFMSNARRRLLT